MRKLINYLFHPLTAVKVIAMAVILLLPSFASAEIITYGEFQFSLNPEDETATLIGPVSESFETDDLSIPEEIQYYQVYHWITLPVTKIGPGAFKDCSNITGSLVLPASIKCVGDSAFLNCTGLIGELIFPETIESIGSRAFSDCTGLVGELNIPESIESIGSCAFSDCTGLESVFISETLVEMGDSVFANCTNLRRASLQSTIMIKVPDYTFAECKSLSIIDLADQISEIGVGAFLNCSSLVPMAIDFGRLKKIGTDAFKGCENLMLLGVFDANDLLELGSGAFFGTHVTYINLEGLKETTLNHHVFGYCRDLQTVLLPETLKEIGEAAFAECPRLWVFNLPEGLEKIGSYAFYNSINEDYMPPKVKLRLPNSITDLGSYTFINCKNLTGELILPEKIQDISYEVFRGCSGFTGSLIIPEGVKLINYGAFMDCSGFSGTLTLPGSLTDLVYDSFAGVTGFEEVICNAITPPKMSGVDGRSAFSAEVYSKAILYVPRESLELYKGAYGWKNFFTIKPIGGVPAESIALDCAEADMVAGKSLTLTATVLPEDADDLTVTWSSSDESVATVDASGKVSAIGVGTATITAATANTLTVNCEVSVWLRGDCNADSRVDVADVVNTNNEIVGNPTSIFIFAAADMTDDGDITVSDAVQIAQLILNTPVSHIRRMAPHHAALPSDYLSVESRGKDLALRISNNAYTALQADIILPEGCTSAEARLGAGATSSHIIMSSRVEAGVLRVIVFSPANSSFIDNGEPVVEVNLSSGNVNEVKLSNIIAAQTDGSSHVLGVNGDGTSAVTSPESSDVEIKAIAGGVRISGAAERMLMISNISGMTIVNEQVESDVLEIGLIPGVYLVKIDDTVSKLIVR